MGNGMMEKLKQKRSYGEDKALMPYQMEAVTFGLHNGGRVLIGDEMGLGKTVEALCLAECYSEEWPMLAIVPSSVKFAWRDEAMEWCTLYPEEIQVLKNGKDLLKKQSRIIIVSYDLFTRNEHFHRRPDGLPYNVIILDECHFIKNRSANRTKICIDVLHTAKRAILLSGTPSLNQASEMFTQFHALCPEVCPSFTSFADRFCEAQAAHFGGGGGGKYGKK